MKENELIIHHSATSNFSKEAMVIFPLVVSEGRETTIDRLLGMEMNETLDLDIGSEITDFTMEINEKQKSAYVVRLSSGLPISKKPTIIEGNCGLTNEEKIQLKNADEHSKNIAKHKHIDTSDFRTLMEEYMENAGKCMFDGEHRIKREGVTVVNKLEHTVPNTLENIPSDYVELTKDECEDIGGKMGTPFAGVPGGFREGSSSNPTSNQEMECFPNEGAVFNKKFHIIYDISSSDEFIAEAGVKIKADDDPGVKNNKTLREAMKAEVKKMREAMHHAETTRGDYAAAPAAAGQRSPPRRYRDRDGGEHDGNRASS